MSHRTAKTTIDADLMPETTAEGVILDMEFFKNPDGKIVSPVDLLLNTKCGFVDNRE